MNVVCPECRSVFRVDPTKIAGAMVRARCAVCGGVITVSRDAAQPGGGGDEFSPKTLRTPAIPMTFGTQPTPAIAQPATSPSSAVSSLPTPAAGSPFPPPARPTPTAPSGAPTPLTSPPIPPRVSSPGAPRPVFTPRTPGGASPSIGGSPTTTPLAPLAPAPGPRPVAPPLFVRPPAPPAPAATSVGVPPSPPPSAGAPPRPVAPPAVPPRPAAPPAPQSPPAASPPPRTSAQTASISGARPINPFLANDPNAKARRLARALVSDLVSYFPQKKEEGLRSGKLKELLGEEIRKSYHEFVDQIGREFAETTTHFTDALNDILAGGQKVFSGNKSGVE